MNTLKNISWPAWLAILFCFALAVRLTALFELSGSPFLLILMGDAEGYDLWAQKIVNSGDWKGDAVFYQAPAYPYFLAVVYSLLGHSVTAVRVIQCVMGALSAAMLAHAGRGFFGRPAGILAGVFYSVYPVAIFYDLTLQKSSLDGFFMASVLLALSLLASKSVSASATITHSPAADSADASAAISDLPSTTPLQKSSGFFVLIMLALALGLATGLLVLTRENALALVPVLPVLLFVLTWQLRVTNRLVLIAAFFVAFSATLAPVAVRNHSISGKWIITTSQAGTNFYIGNNPAADGTYKPLRPGRGSYRFERTDAVELAEAGAGRKLSPDEVSTYWMDESKKFITQEPGKWLALMGKKTLLLFSSLEAGDTEDPYSFADGSWVLWICLACLNIGTLFGLSFIAVISPAGRWRAVMSVFAIALVFGLSVVAFYVFGRYRFPMVPALVLLAGFGVVRLIDLLAQRLESQGAVQPRLNFRIALCATVFVLALIIARLPLLDRDGIKAVTYNNIASHYLEQNLPPEQAVLLLEKAITLMPAYAQAHSNMGAALARSQGPAAAIAAYEKAVMLMPELAAARYNLAAGLLEAGQVDAALFQAQEGLKLEPENVDLLAVCGRAFVALNQMPQGINMLGKATTLGPDRTDILNSLGVAYARSGNLQQAEQTFGRIVAINPADPSARFNRARALISLGKNDQARAELQDHLKYHPSDKQAQVLMQSLSR